MASPLIEVLVILVFVDAFLAQLFGRGGSFHGAIDLFGLLPQLLDLFSPRSGADDELASSGPRQLVLD